MKYLVEALDELCAGAVWQYADGKLTILEGDIEQPTDKQIRAKEAEIADIRMREDAFKVVKQRHAETLRQLSGNASDEEMHSWPRKALAAEKYLEGTASEKQKRIIEGGADRRDLAFDVFAKLILKKAEIFDDLIGQADDLKERTDAAIKAAETAEDVAAILEASEAEAAVALTKWLSAA